MDNNKNRSVSNSNTDKNTTARARTRYNVCFGQGNEEMTMFE
jgi:hypothetical protein